MGADDSQSRLGLDESESPALEIANRLNKLLLGVHNEGPEPSDRLDKRLRGYQQEPHT